MRLPSSSVPPSGFLPSASYHLGPSSQFGYAGYEDPHCAGGLRDEVSIAGLLRENDRLKRLAAESMLKNRGLKKGMIGLTSEEADT